MAILWGPFTFAETDQTILNGGHTVKSIPIDFTGFPTGAGVLTLVVLAGQVQYDDGNFAGLNVIVGGTPELYFGGQIVWNGFGPPVDTRSWTDWLPVLVSLPTTPFTSPGPGVTNLNLQADAGASAPTPAGFRNYTIQIEGPSPGPPAPRPVLYGSVGALLGVDTFAVIGGIAL